jgi:hypothetical protein
VTKEQARASHIDRLLRKLFDDSPVLLLEKLASHPRLPARRRSLLKKALGGKAK